MNGPDHKSSLNVKNFKLMIKNIRKTEEILGIKIKLISHSEKKNIPIIRKSIFAKKKLKKMIILVLKNIKTLRPVIGIPAENIFKILNKKSKKRYFEKRTYLSKKY